MRAVSRDDGCMMQIIRVYGLHLVNLINAPTGG